MSRDVWVIDLETTGLDRNVHLPVEVAAINLKNGREIHFVPFITGEALGQADREAMRINKYHERALYKDQLDRNNSIRSYQDLFELLHGQTLAGANPRFDADMLLNGYAWQLEQGPLVAGVSTRIEEPWHHRLADLCAYTAGQLDISPDDIPGLAGVCQLLGVTNEAEHTAIGDARATVQCFRRLYPGKDQ
ncbi:Exonuclease [Mycobacteroides abscessus subsp. abscessus]|uniref:3'-5' exonuclease n=1 Tax=Mycobacteroides abscessus TaxID=36809 RepID=UPI00092BAE1D|nr:exonuclease domain-containing protein [Mycobacteroides abscessus]WJJ56091.1 DnaQ-like exonuclease [Mycobacterium phage prophiT37-1]SID32652.1 Exonuclease [Mycobacteroides abscessus subsp. abscessus]SID67542.1 Exonuclease [Mycobacteroides abscessus subsp. abscessus]SKG40150.1 Exonuclease [Mycobacteroides abscessus subsp. abscessus]SKQ79430.1 Exonuclease [Mycobacteroides abscessus subsp. abscessus]